MLKSAIQRVVRKESLTKIEAQQTMERIMQGEATAAQIGALLVGLRMRGETPSEIAGFAQAMRQHALPLDLKEELVDTCGTGGDSSGTFNISTTVAFVVAACGLSVAKHGNRAISSKSGSADLLSALGVNIHLTPCQVASCISKAGIGFLYAPTFHQAMQHASGPRRELGMRTVFNLLGPLTNPARPAYQTVGVWDPQLVFPVAQVLRDLGVHAAMVFHGSGGLDELSLAGENLVAELEDGNIKTYTLSPSHTGLGPAPTCELAGGTPQENAAITLKILSGERGARRDVVLLNSAALLKVAGVAKGWREAVAIARHAIDSGGAMERLEALRKLTGEVGEDAVSDCGIKTRTIGRK
jgi:anthranilate phosphoribosyltransferase